MQPSSPTSECAPVGNDSGNGAQFRPNRPRPDRAAIDNAKRVIQQEIFEHSNAESEEPPASPNRVVTLQRGFR
jgi:hypothetical protein